MPKYFEKSSTTSKTNEVAPQANAIPSDTAVPGSLGVTPSDLLEAIKELKSDLKGDNDQLRKTMHSIHQEMSSKLDALTEEAHGLKEQMWEMEAHMMQQEEWAGEVFEALTAVMQWEKKLQHKLTGLESRSRNNIRISGVAEGEDGNSAINFVSEFRKRELPMTAEVDLKLKWAHYSLAL